MLRNYFNENSRLTYNKLTSEILLCTGLYSLVVCVKSPHSLVPRSFGFSHKQLVNTTPYAALSTTQTIYINMYTHTHTHTHIYIFFFSVLFQSSSPEENVVVLKEIVSSEYLRHEKVQSHLEITLLCISTAAVILAYGLQTLATG